jgi:VIT1/CCC1 family predicted Fe2+/Mn2+ transporter
VLDPIERFSEILFGLIMVLTFTGSLSATSGGRNEVRTMLIGALGVFLLVFLSTFPVAIPFLLMHDAMLALRVSNGIAIVLLFVGGYKLAKFSGFHPWWTGLTMVAIGTAVVALTIALGG